jgi:hypothetical protein
MAKSTNAKAVILNLALLLSLLLIFSVAESRIFGGKFWSFIFSFHHSITIALQY